jgi:hypothetical protein
VAADAKEISGEVGQENPNPSADGMTDEELLALIRSHEQASLGSQVAAGATISTTIYPSNMAMPTLEIQRYDAINAYYARPLGNEVENRSQIVLPELRDTIEWMMPQLMRMFVGSKTVCRFDPDNQQDEAQAEQETATVNHVFMTDNDGVMVLHDFFKDALLMSNGYVEVYTKEVTEVGVERYTGLTEIELALLFKDKADEESEVLEQTEREVDLHLPPPQLPPSAPMPPQMQQAPKITVYDVKLRNKQKKKKVCVVALPPEEMRISARARGGMDDAVFAMHITNVTRSDLVTEGYDKEWVDSLAAGRPNWLEIDALARNKVVDQLSVENPSDRATQEIELRKVIMRVDYDGDGVAELRRIVVGGDKIGENEVIEETPFASCVPKRMPHRHTGISLYEEIMDLQIIKTQLFRGGLDNLNIANNTRLAVDWRSVNVDDLTTSRPSAPIRGNGPPSQWILPIQQPTNVISEVLPMLGYIDELKTVRTGVGKNTMGADADELQNVTKGAQLAAMSAASLKIELVARLLAEGVKDIFRKIHSEIIRHQDKPMELEISGKWVTVDPTQWRRRSKVTPNVGLGSGNREEMRANIAVIGPALAQLAQMGMVGPKQMFESWKYICEATGIMTPERFALDPSSPEYQQHMQQMQQQQHMMPPAPQVQAAQIRASTEQSKQASEDQRKILDLQGKLIDSKRQQEAEQLQQLQQLIHDSHQGHRDREMQLDTNHLQILLKLIPAIAQVIAAEKRDPAELGSDVTQAGGQIQ